MDIYFSRYTQTDTDTHTHIHTPPLNHNNKNDCFENFDRIQLQFLHLYQCEPMGIEIARTNNFI